MIAVQHTECLLVTDDLHIRILLAQQADTAGMVGFHMVHDQIIERTSVQRIRYFFQKDIRIANVYCIDQYSLFVYDQIRIIRNAVRKRPHIFEEGLLTVVYSYIIYLICYFF